MSPALLLPSLAAVRPVQKRTVKAAGAAKLVTGKSPPVSNTWSWVLSNCPQGILARSGGHCGEMRFGSFTDKGALVSQANLPKQINTQTPFSPF